MPVTVKLSRPITTHKGELSQIELRDLTADDMIAVGVSPLVFINLGSTAPTEVLRNTDGSPVPNRRADQKIEVNYKIAGEYLARLSGIDRILLGAMKGSDFNKCVDAVVALWSEAEGE